MKQKHDVPLWLVEMCLEYMEPIKNDSDREKFCIGFDVDYEHKKRLYKEITGREWQGTPQA